jgi:GMP synthase (glutamine-hydrolysing)
MSKLRILIVDGYAKASREQFQKVSVRMAWEQYRDMLLSHAPDAAYDVLFPSDPGTELAAPLTSYDGLLWTGCNLTIYQIDDARVVRMLELGKKAYAVGLPSYGSCWGLQMAAAAAGGEIRKNPRGREMGIARKIHLTAEGRAHPFYAGKASVFDGFISHYDEVTQLPPGATLLATNDFTHVQALAVTHQKGTFWAVQYHPEYALYDMARLIVAREEGLIKEGFFAGREDFQALVARLEALHREPARKDLRWQLGIDDDVIDPRIRQCEFSNWIERLVIPTAAKRRA